MIIYMDIDNTICHTDQTLPSPAKYKQATPIHNRIAKVNKLYAEGHEITYWTSRGNSSKQDLMALTLKQLESWGCKYHALKLGKPSFDLFVDDKACDCEAWCPINPKPVHAPELAVNLVPTCSRVSRPAVVPKGWGHELIIVNTPKYCGKILHFRAGGKFSMHYHLLKEETWYVASGRFRFLYIDTKDATIYETILGVGDVVTNYVGQPHQIICEEEGDIFETSTEHFDSDSYRVFKGDSQRLPL
jgi:mannose-6-phosphate isomerase-like protein (cupin superfamily)